jgi:hypothetical protein
VHEAIISTTMGNMSAKWRQSNSIVGMEVRRLILDDKFWFEIKNFLIFLSLYFTSSTLQTQIPLLYDKYTSQMSPWAHE